MLSIAEGRSPSQDSKAPSRLKVAQALDAAAPHVVTSQGDGWAAGPLRLYFRCHAPPCKMIPNAEIQNLAWALDIQLISPVVKAGHSWNASCGRGSPLHLSTT
ncbi:unnamed protein product [Symbiodinium natans]|uniref:Uncharacterized protein n=1 Tax=Symbiodinium natans TaxID=878477 RepID=A0A812VAI1_9DINO|nr:unnamed protein product [Symbiodinium natans]